MRVQFLGITGSIQHAHSGNVSLLISHAGTKILVDISGSPVQNLALCEVDPLDVTHLLLTHSHVDHLYGLPSLLHQLWLMGRTSEFVIMGNHVTIKKARQLCAVFSLEEKKGMFPLVWKNLDEEIQFVQCKSLGLDLFPVTHGIPTFGCLFTSEQGTIAYLADTAPMKEYPPMIQNPSLLIHEAGGVDSERETLNGKGHSSALQAAKVAEYLHAERLFLCHLPEQENIYPDMLAEARHVFPLTDIPEVFQVFEV